MGGIKSYITGGLGRKENNDVEFMWHVKSVIVSFAYALNISKWDHLGRKESFSL
jgi:hypothetical protein